MSMLEIDGLKVSFATAGGEIPAVRDFSLNVHSGECVGVVGESGAGKSQSFLALLGLLPANARVSGSARFRGLQLIGQSAATLDAVRGSDMTVVFQDPLTSLTPHLKIGEQLSEPLRRHRGLSSRAARTRGRELLERVYITDPDQRLQQYPHELSGGMRQRVMIAMALACEPTLLIADEPTTALDVTVQAQILALLAELKRERGMAMVLITHDLGVIAGLADRVAVMQGGCIVECADTRRVLKQPAHPHTRALLDAMPRLDCPPLDLGSSHTLSNAKVPLLDISQLQVRFSKLRAVDGVNLKVHAGESVGIVGESGSGKSTLARAAMGLLPPTDGRIVWRGCDRPARRTLQIVFQDPLASLDPRMTVAESVIEPLRVHQRRLTRKEQLEAAAQMLGRVGLTPEFLQRYPHELSGGQCQRVGIARAMILKPNLLICDEAVSALDVTTQAQVVELIRALRREYGLALLFISHNLAVVRQLCQRVLVLYLGRMMESASAEALYGEPRHPYTRALLDAMPVADPEIQPRRLSASLEAELPSPLSPPAGCVFHTRCSYAIELCRRRVPVWEPVEDGRQIACHRWREIV